MEYVTKLTEGAPHAALFLTFHGTGGDEHQFHDFARGLMPAATVLSPRGDVSEHGANRYFRRTGEGVYDMADLARQVARMAGFVGQAKAARQPAATIGLGYSNGANILAALAFAHPDLFDRLVLMHPLIPFTPAPQPGLAGKRVLITAGARDPICPAPMTRALAGWFEAQGADVQVLWHPGGHEIRPEEGDGIGGFLAA